MGWLVRTRLASCRSEDACLPEAVSNCCTVLYRVAHGKGSFEWFSSRSCCCEQCCIVSDAVVLLLLLLLLLLVLGKANSNQQAGHQ